MSARKERIVFDAEVINARFGHLRCNEEFAAIRSSGKILGLIIAKGKIKYIERPAEYSVHFRDGVYSIAPISVWPSLHGHPTCIRRLYFDLAKATEISLATTS